MVQIQIGNLTIYINCIHYIIKTNINSILGHIWMFWNQRKRIKSINYSYLPKRLNYKMVN